MKLLLITGSLNQGGAEYQILQLARLLQKKGHSVEIIALTDYSYYLPFITGNRIKYSCVSNKGNNLKRLIRAVRQINKKKPDLVISYIKRVSQVAILARVLSGFRFKLITSERTSLIKPWHDLFYFNLSLLANKITVNSITKISNINKRFPLLKNKTVFIPNIIDITRFSNIQHDKSVDGEVRISYVGRISPEKNIINLIEAIRQVHQQGYKVILSLIGEANNKNYLHEVNQLIEELELEDVVTFKGASNEITEVYKKTDLLCLVSVFEGFSNVLSEAISCGIPVIASDIPENRYLVEDEKNGILVDGNNPQSIAAGIERFLKLTPVEVNSISENNKIKAKEIFDEESTYQKYAEIFKQIGAI